MKANDLRDLDDGELVKHVTEMRKEVFGLRFANATGELDDTAGLNRAKRDLARALTVARERTLQGTPERAPSLRQDRQAGELAAEPNQRG
jgi:large subunit ribosomal protein L29